MTKGDPVWDDSSVDAAASWDIKTVSGAPILLTNLYYGAGITITKVTPAGSSVVHTDATGGILTNASFKISDTHYLTITNTSASAQVVSYDGVKMY